jgi:ABC-type lipoprotein export system ATPase subunit
VITPMMCEDVRQVYPTEDGEVEALAGVSKEFAPGAITTIAGPSGSGKSTLLRILACITRPERGRVRVEDLDVVRLSGRRRRRLRRYRLAYLFQNPADNLIEYLTAAQQVRVSAEVRGAHVDNAEVLELLDKLGIAHRADHKPDELSGGEQQRLAVACAVVGSPAIVLVDEPTAELDTASSLVVIDALRAMRSHGATFAVTSHDPSVLEASDHMLRLDRGHTVESW